MTWISGLPEHWPILLALVAFGALGVRRGWIRELATLGGLLFAWLVVVLLGLSIVEAVNKLALIASFTWDGGFDASDPGAMLRALRASPLIDPWRPEWLFALLFALGALSAYLVGHRMAVQVRTLPEAVLGGVAGALNGYVISYVLLGYADAATRLPGRPSPVGDASGLLSGYVSSVVVAVVIGAVAIAMLTSGRAAAPKPKRTGRAHG